MGPLSDNEVRARRELERENMHKVLDAYIHICNQAEVYAEKRFVEMSDIGKGIVELIELHAVTKLVMGAAADVHYSEGMTELKSTKAMFVNLHAHPSCQIWFTCRGRVIHRREGDLNTVDMDFMPSSVPLYSEESNSRSSPSSTASSEVDDDLVMVTYERGESSGSIFVPASAPLSEDAHHFPPFNPPEAIRNDEIYDQFERSMVEAENARREAFGGLMRRLQKSEKNAIEAIRRARAFENMYKEESRRRKELEDILTKEKQAYEAMTKELNDKIVASERMLESCKQERDDLQVERDNAVGITEDLLRDRASEASSSQQEGFLSEFSFLEIQRATDNFEPSKKIGEDGYCNIYRGFLHHTQVAVKMLQSDSPRAPSQFQQELDIMSKLRHPNLMTLIGICPEACALVYEYLPNGSLEDQLLYQVDTPLLSYQTRIRIASEICSALIFLHTNKPSLYIHGDLRPGNILLDANFAAKLCGFGRGPGLRINLEPGDCPHVDPHFLTTGELSAKSDVYSFGVVLLQLLTGRVAFNLDREMRDAVNGGNTSYMTALLDPLAGEWPVRLATDLAHLALRCCDMDPNNRPDLGSEVWSVLEMQRASHVEVPSFHQSNPEEDDRVPDNYLCPISHEIMEEPTVAADGYTYEAQEVREWLDRGHNTSPLTNLPLDHLNLTPNRVVRSMIQEWLDNHPHFSVS
ncbi:U-box domain-containing protein 33-like isoform X2 [Punica granatum]|nr:U-box domain-containing protein 33-like isoform X2 [Punica granatum]